MPDCENNKTTELIAIARNEGRTIEIIDSLQEGLKLVVYASGKVVRRQRYKTAVLDDIEKKRG